MSTKIDCGNRLHQRVAGATPDEILAANPRGLFPVAERARHRPATNQTEHRAEPDPAQPDHDNKAATSQVIP
jgi:hypothetical protein